MRADADASTLWDDQSFRDRIADMAAARGLSVRQVCSAAGLSAEYLNKAAGRSGRSVEALLRIARVMGVPLAELVGDGSSPLDELVWRLGMTADVAAQVYLALKGRRPSNLRPEDVAAAVWTTIQAIEATLAYRVGNSPQ